MDDPRIVGHLEAFCNLLDHSDAAVDVIRLRGTIGRWADRAERVGQGRVFAQICQYAAEGVAVEITGGGILPAVRLSQVIHGQDVWMLQAGVP